LNTPWKRHGRQLSVPEHARLIRQWLERLIARVQ
jgi:hypothetical protein